MPEPSSSSPRRDPPHGRRIVVIGGTGSGKSTLAQALAGRLAVPFVELDALFWLPDWQERDTPGFRALVDDATQGDAWVVAGNYTSRIQDIVWGRADQIVWLDYPLWVSFPRVFRRCVHRWRTGELLWGTNTESLWKHFLTPESLLWWSIKTYRPNKRRYEAMLRDPQWSHIDFVRQRSPAQTERWLASLPRDARSPKPGA